MKLPTLPLLSCFLLFACSPRYFISTPRPDLSFPDSSGIAINQAHDVWLLSSDEQLHEFLKNWWAYTRNIGVREFLSHAPGTLTLFANKGIIIHFNPDSDKYISFHYGGSLHLRETTEADKRLRQYLLQHMRSRKPIGKNKAAEWIVYLHARYRAYNFNQWEKNHHPAR